MILLAAELRGSDEPQAKSSTKLMRSPGFSPPLADILELETLKLQTSNQGIILESENNMHYCENRSNVHSALE
jgi:hypothetical protein